MKTIYYITDVDLLNSSVHTVHVDEVCKNLAALEYSVTLYAPKSEFSDIGAYEKIYIATPLFLRSLFFQPVLFVRLCVDVARNRPWVIYCRQSQFLLVPTIVGKIFQIPLVLEVNGRLLQEMEQAERSLLGRILLYSGILKLIEYLNVRFSSHIVVVAQDIKKYLENTYKRLDINKISVIANGVDTDVFIPLDKAECRARTELNNNAFIVGYVGIFRSWQGLGYIVTAANLIHKKYPNVVFLLVGGGEEKENILRFIREYKLERAVLVLDAVEHDRVPLYIGAFDVCLNYPLKSRTASPFKVYEYLSSARPVICSDIQELRNEFGNTLVYVKPEAPEELVESIIALINDRERQSELSKSGRKFVEEGRSWRSVAEKILTVCKSLQVS